MSDSWALPGLERLLDVVHRHDVPIVTLPVGRSSPRAGEELCGMQVDPLLAAAFARLGKLAVFRSPVDTWLMLPCTDEMNGILLENREWQSFFPHMFWPDHFRTLMLFGREGLYGYATVPELANSKGLQPVVFVDPYEDIHALPLASDLDRFFDAYSRYVEMAAQDYGYQGDGIPWVSFPYGVPDIIARDRLLLGMIKEGRFDHLMYERGPGGWRREEDLAHTREWIGKILDAR